MQFHQAILTYSGKTQLLQPDRANSFDELYVDFRQEEVNGGRHWSVFLHPKQDILLERLELQFEIPLPAGSRFFVNGYQSWHESRLFRLDEAMPQLHRFAHRQPDFSGQPRLPDIPGGRGRLYSWSYTYLKKPAATVLAGSLSERTGFTLFLYDQATGILTVRKDLGNLPLAHSFPALDFWIGESTEKDVFDAWFGAMEIKKPAVLGGLGWSSNQMLPEQVTAGALTQSLENIQVSALPFQYFLIEDGWQKAVGDWFSVKQAFPAGMAAMASAIRDKGLTPGLWLAPFIVSANANLLRSNPDWLVQDAKGRPLKVGRNPRWHGWYYALDFYNPAVRDYLSGVFHTVFDKWGFDLVKLDFLFAARVAPPPGKTRGAVMWEAMEFLREQAGSRQMLAGGAPFGACFGQTDYACTGGESASDLDTLRRTLGRWQLHGRAFVSVPGMFSLRKEKQRAYPILQNTILTVNALLGDLLFMGDDLSSYSPEQMTELESALDLRGSVVQAVNALENDVFRIDFEKSGERFFAWCNLSAKKVSPDNTLQLLPFETLVLRRWA